MAGRLLRLRSPGSQFGERRNFERLYGDDPLAQTLFVKHMVGFIALHEELGPIQANSRQLAEAARTVVRGFLESFPECLRENYEVINHDVGYSHYSVQPEFLDSIKRVLGDDIEK